MKAAIISPMRYHHHLSVSWEMDLCFTRDVFAVSNDDLFSLLRPDLSAPPRRCLVFVDQGVTLADPYLTARIHAWFTAHEDRGLHLAAVPQIVAGGESAKDGLAIVERVGRCCLDHGICRHSAVIIIGGGAVLDAVGLGATLVHRGVRQIRLPTTTLAQGDAGLGVKNGVNAFGNKNFFGTFQPPQAIVNDSRFLDHCPDRDRRAGLAEAVKVSLIKDPTFFAWLAAHASQLLDRQRPTLLEEAVQRCALLHLDHITGGGDPFETGSSRPLDFGHWSAHRLEVLSQHRLSHGEAVAIGVALDSAYALRIGRLSAAEHAAVLDTLETLGFYLWDAVCDLRDANGSRSLFAGLEQFREHLGGELTLAMPNGIGHRQDIHDYDPRLGEACLRELKTRHQRLNTETKILSPR